MRRADDVVIRMNGSLEDMHELGCPGEWINDMEAGVLEINKLRKEVELKDAIIQGLMMAIEDWRNEFHGENNG